MINRREFIPLVAAAALFSEAARAASSVADELWVDAKRNREVPALIRWPSGKPLGWVLYSHGLGGSREGGDLWGKAWADAGLVVVHLQHHGSDAPALKGGFGALRSATSAEQFVARVQDIKFAIDEVKRRADAGQGQWRDVPLDQLAIAGHSFGARSTLAEAGWSRRGQSFGEPRAKAFIALSPAVGDANLAQATKELAACTRPMLVVSGSLDGAVLNNGESPEGRRLVYDALPAGKKYLLWLEGADHMTFGGNAKRITSTMLYRRTPETLSAEPAHQELVARTSTAWLLAQLTGRAVAAPSGLKAGDVWLAD